MNETSGSGVNPFATRFIKPGALAFLFPPGESATLLVERLRGFDWQGEIVAPHGSGKSTLLAELEPHLLAANRTIVRVTLHNGEAKLPAILDSWRTWNDHTLIVVDGFEQLSWWSRTKLAWRCHQQGAGRLVTSHATTGLPGLLRLKTDMDLAERVVRKLGVTEEVLSRETIAKTLAACEGNLRETLFQLYDWYEQTTRQR